MIDLRDFRQEDIEPLVIILNDPDVTQYLSTKIPQPYTQDDALWWVNEGSKLGYIKAITLDGVLVGCIGVNRGEFEYSRSGEIGYWLAKPYWRQGITSLAIGRMLDFVFTQTDIERIFAAVFSDNQPSMRLLLKSGFSQEAVLQKAIYKNGHFYHSHIFTFLRQS